MLCTINTSFYLVKVLFIIKTDRFYNYMISNMGLGSYIAL